MLQEVHKMMISVLLLIVVDILMVQCVTSQGWVDQLSEGNLFMSRSYDQFMMKYSPSPWAHMHNNCSSYSFAIPSFIRRFALAPACLNLLQQIPPYFYNIAHNIART